MQNPVSFVIVPYGYVVSDYLYYVHNLFVGRLFSFCNLSSLLISEIVAQEILSALQVKQEWH
jgi:hypothetical protein